MRSVLPRAAGFAVGGIRGNRSKLKEKGASRAILLSSQGLLDSELRKKLKALAEQYDQRALSLGYEHEEGVVTDPF